jgi:tetratricopeptide (TPR) repeat protein
LANIDKNKLIESANKFIAKNQLDKAIKDLQKILEIEPKNSQVALKIAELFLKLDKKEDAVNYYEIAANIFSSSGFYDKAIAVLRQILTINPVSSQTYIKLAELFKKKNLIAEAVSNYKVAIAIYEKEGKTKEALKILQTITELEPSNLSGRMKLAELYIKNNLKEQAYTELTQIAKRLVEAKRTIDLITVYEKMLSIKPGEISIIKELIRLYLSRGDYQKVLIKVKDAITSGNSDTEILLALAKAYVALDKIPHAISAYKEVAKLYTKSGLDTQAEEIYKKILELDPTDQQALQKIVGTKEEPPAIKEITPEPIETKEEKYTIEKPKEHIEELIAKPKEVISEQIPKKEQQIEKAKIETHFRASSTEPEHRKEEKPPPEEIEKLFSEAQVYKRYGLNNKAEEKLKQILEFSPSNRNVLTELFELYEVSKRYKEASTLAERLYNLFIADGEIEKAESFVKKAIANDPHNEVLKALIGYAAPSEQKEVIQQPEEQIIKQPEEENIPPSKLTETEVESRQEKMPISSQEEIKSELDQQRVTAEAVGGSEEIDTGIEIEVETTGPQAENIPEETKIEPRTQPSIAESSADNAGSEQPAKEIPIPEQLNFTPELTEEKETEINVAPEEKQEDELGISFSEEEFEVDNKEPHVEPVVQQPPQPPLVTQEKEQPRQDIDIIDSLDEAEFYYQQGIISEAKEILQKILSIAPNEQRAKERLAEILAKEAEQNQQVDNKITDLDESFIQKEAEHVVTATADEGLFDLAEELEKELSITSAASQAEQQPEEEQQVSVEEVLEAFKKGVEKSVDKQDAETHYNLGIAYKEMGLIDEAINEFNIATLSPEKKADGLIMLGMSYMGKGLPGKAIEMYKQALDAKGGIKPENIGLLYEFAIAYEAYGDMQNAYNYFEEVKRMDENFRDVKEKVEQLKKFVEGETTIPPKAQEEKEKFTLDELLKEDMSEEPIQKQPAKEMGIILNEESNVKQNIVDEKKDIEDKVVVQNKQKPVKKKVSYI